MKKLLTTSIVVSVFVVLSSVVAAQSPQVELSQLVVQLQKTPMDNALREKIIKLAAEMKPAPAIPEEAEKYEGRAKFAFKNAKSTDDYIDAAKEYEKAVQAAPWIPGYYSDLCTIYEKAGRYADAKRHCEFYLLSITGPEQTSETKQRIAGLEFGIEKAEKEKMRTEFTEPRTGLIWRRCAEGMVFSNGDCYGTAGKFTFDEARQQAESEARRTGSAWRLPTKNELAGIIAKGRDPAIDPIEFPATPASFFWSATPYNFERVWSVYFGTGNFGNGEGNSFSESLRTIDNYVRLVRNGR